MCTSRALVAFVLAPWAVSQGSVALADGDPLLGVEFQDLRGVLSMQPGGNGGVFTAGAVNEPGLLSWGHVWRNASPAGDALFDTGFVGEPDPAGVNLTLTIGQIRDKRADVNGSAVFTDVDGDTITLLLAGTMTFGPGGEVVTNAMIDGVEVRSDEGYFDGTDGGSVRTDEFDDARGSFVVNFNYQFHQTGQGRTHVGPASISGEANEPRGGPVPPPSMAATLAMAGLGVFARRRRAPIGAAA